MKQFQQNQVHVEFALQQSADFSENEKYRLK
jgi:hypothetical protein